MQKGLKRFTDFILRQDSLTTECKKDGGIHFEIMRVKNGFSKMIDKKGEVPSRYMDIKFNLIVTVWDIHTHAHVSLVGELQFLLTPMYVYISI